MKRLPFDKRPRKPRAPKKRQFSSIARPTFEEAAAKAREAGPRRPVKKKRRTKEQHERIYGPKHFADWIHQQPCIVATTARARPCQGCIEQAHTQTGGMGRKADHIHSVPLCKAHHIDLHTIGRTSFESYHNVSLQDAAARTGLKYQEFCQAFSGQAEGGE